MYLEKHESGGHQWNFLGAVERGHFDRGENMVNFISLHLLATEQTPKLLKPWPQSWMGKGAKFWTLLVDSHVSIISLEDCMMPKVSGDMILYWVCLLDATTISR
jgi:hypothetical protein